MNGVKENTNLTLTLHGIVSRLMKLAEWELIGNKKINMTN